MVWMDSCSVLLLFSLLFGRTYAQAGETVSEAGSDSTQQASSPTTQLPSDATTTTTTTTTRAPSRVESPEEILERTMLQLMNATSMEEAINLGLLRFNDHALTAADLVSSSNDSSGRQTVSGGLAGLPQPDNCSPRDMSVRILGLQTSALSRVYPSCVRVPRCGGCCGAKNTACIPIYKEKRRYTVLEVTVLQSSVTVMNQRDVEVEHHLTCECQCQLSAEKCGPLKNFDPYQCTCTCKNRSVRCLPPHMFSPETCGCDCAERQECCSPGQPCNLVFNERTCSCDAAQSEVRSRISGNTATNLTNTYRGRTRGTAAPPTRTATTAPAADTTTPRRRQSTNCSTHRCSRGLRVVFRAGRGCMCIRARSTRPSRPTRPTRRTRTSRRSISRSYPTR